MRAAETVKTDQSQPNHIHVLMDQMNRVIGDPVAMRMNRRRRSGGANPRPVMPSFNNGRRQSLTELRPRHLVMVEEFGWSPRDGNQRALTSDELRDYFLSNYNRLFGCLRKSKALEMPSDQLRKEIMIERLIGLIEMRRAEYAMMTETME
jgi:hypothetical protein